EAALPEMASRGLQRSEHVGVGHLVAEYREEQHDGIEASIEVDRPDIPLQKGRAGRDAPRAFEHCLRAINADDLISAPCELVCVQTRSASQIQNAGNASSRVCREDLLEEIALARIVLFRVESVICGRVA